MTGFGELSMWEEMDAMPDGMGQNMEDMLSDMGEVTEEDVAELQGDIAGISLEPELRYDLPNCEEAWVTGGPYEDAAKMDYQQGDNPYHARGNCGLVSLSNTLRRAGIDVTEDDVTKYAIENNLCIFDADGDEGMNGGTTLEMRQEILKGFGFESDVYYSETGGSLEEIADAIDSGRGVLISVNAGVLWDVDDGTVPVNGKPPVNHCVAVTGIARDAETGEIRGVYIADSGRGDPGDACRYLTTEEFHEVYTDVYGSGANITREPLVEG